MIFEKLPDGFGQLFFYLYTLFEDYQSMYKNSLFQPVTYTKGVGPVKGDTLLKEAGISTCFDMINYFPYRYVDRSFFHKIAEIKEEGNFVQIRGKIVGIQTAGEKRKTRLMALLRDETGVVELIWFQGIKWISEKIKLGVEYIVFGRTSLYGSKFNIAHPEIEPLTDFAKAPPEPFRPLYNSTEKMKMKGLDSRGIARIVKAILLNLKQPIPETLPAWLLKKENLTPRNIAFRDIHFPQSGESIENARLRLKYEELLLMQLQLLLIKQKRKSFIKGIKFDSVGPMFHNFYHNNIPFELTNAQKRVVKEIRADMGSGKQMSRLLQGDVGSGKTLVALMAAIIAIGNGYQTAFMAPTEILANQHLKTIAKFLSGLKINVALLTGSTKTAEKRLILKELKDGTVDLLIGTHALIEDTVVFNKLGFVVIDEQHKFGVDQRAKMRKDGELPPHTLIMTATPIPRTLALTYYGDLDFSIIDEMPPGRKPVKTAHYFDGKRNMVFDFMKQQIDAGRQVYVVYPLIQESEKLDLKDLNDGYESITRAFPLPEYAVSMVHGKLTPDVKEYEMNRFVKGETQILVSTTVIEVGVDVPNASVMVIESAQRFGLSQLHQLRGRVGRGADQSYCILMTEFELSNEARKRMATMVETNDGFKIADADLALRGPGDFQGTRQSGMPELKIADLAKDESILKRARAMAELIVERDSNLRHPANYVLKQTMAEYFRGSDNYLGIG